MNTKKLAVVCLLVLVATMSTTLYITPVNAQSEGHWITSYTVEDAQTGQKLIEADFATSETPNVISPVISGAELKVTFTVNVFTSGSGDLKLATSMSTPTSGPVWELISEDYDLGTGFAPNSQTFTFSWKSGTFEMIAYGRARTVTKSTPITLVIFSAVGATEYLDSINATILTAGADEFQNLYDQKEAKLQGLIDSGVAAGYTQMFSNVLNQSKALIAKGYVNEAIALLNAIPNSGEPAGSAFELIMFPAIGVAAVAAVLFAFMFLRARGKNSYYRLVVEEQIKDLEGLTLRAAKIDRTMSSSLDSVKDRLKRLVGM